jgi:putative DNA primase/helicase
VQIDRKNKDPWVGQLGVRFSLSSNEEVRLPDASGAIVSRFIFNRTSGSHYGHEDYTLLDRILKDEMPGVLNRVLDHIDDVYEKWPVSAHVNEIMESMKNASQPLRAWIEDNEINVGPEYALAVGAAYRGYVDWAEQNGYHKMNSATFGKALRALLPALTVVRLGNKGEQVRNYVGLGYEKIPGR